MSIFKRKIRTVHTSKRSWVAVRRFSSFCDESTRSLLRLQRSHLWRDGDGKELIARAIHDRSARKNRPW